MRALPTVFICFLLIACNNGKKVKTENISNSKTPRHVNIPGTRLFIIPPEGFIIDRNVVGFTKSLNGKTIAVLQVVDSFGKVYQPLNIDNLKKRATITTFTNLKVNGYDGQYIEAINDPLAGSQNYLFFGDYSLHAFVLTTVYNGDSVINAALKTAIRTVYYDKDKKISPYETAAFTVDDSKSSFKLSRVSDGDYLFRDSAQKELYPTMIIGPLPTAPHYWKDVFESKIPMLKKQGLTNITLKYSTRDKINGIDALECEIHADLVGILTTEKILLYDVALSKNDKVFIVEGIAKDNFEFNLNQFKRLAYTVVVTE